MSGSDCQGANIKQARIKMHISNKSPYPFQNKFPAKSIACARLREIYCLKGVINTFADKLIASDLLRCKISPIFIPRLCLKMTANKVENYELLDSPRMCSTPHRKVNVKLLGAGLIC